MLVHHTAKPPSSAKANGYSPQRRNAAWPQPKFVLVLVVVLVLEARWHQLDRVCLSASFRLLCRPPVLRRCASCDISSSGDGWGEDFGGAQSSRSRRARFQAVQRLLSGSVSTEAHRSLRPPDVSSFCALLSFSRLCPPSKD
jgi:hypothetical protein